MEPSLTFAEKAFDNTPYTPELFDAVAAYYETLRRLRSTPAQNVRRKLNWVLWHDPRRIDKQCCTGRILRAIQAMEPKEAFAWQWLLRHRAAGLNGVPGKAWLKEANKRLSRVGEKDFLRRIEEWFIFPEHGALTARGSSVL